MENLSKAEFVDQVLKAHKTVIVDAWDKWIELLGEEPKPRKGKKLGSETKYPNGFKDFLVEFIDRLIADNEAELSPK